MKNKQYYIDLSERWFDALLTEEEERALKAFLASTDDPDFDDVKAVAGYFATGKALHGSQKASRRPAQRRQMHRLGGHRGRRQPRPFRGHWAIQSATESMLHISIR